MSLEEFVTKARLLVDDSGYLAAVKDESLRDALVFGLRSDKVRRDAIAKGNELTFQQVYELAKVDESTRAQMKAITQSEDKMNFIQLGVKRNLHSSRSLKMRNRKTKVTRSHSRNHLSSSQRDASDVEAAMTNLQSVQPSLPNASIMVNRDITLKCALKGIIIGFIR